MLFTDGGEEKAEEIFKKYNPKQAVGWETHTLASQSSSTRVSLLVTFIDYSPHRCASLRFRSANTTTTKDQYSGWPVRTKVTLSGLKIIISTHLEWECVIHNQTSSAFTMDLTSFLCLRVLLWDPIYRRHQTQHSGIHSHCLTTAQQTFTLLPQRLFFQSSLSLSMLNQCALCPLVVESGIASVIRVAGVSGRFGPADG